MFGETLSDRISARCSQVPVGHLFVLVRKVQTLPRLLIAPLSTLQETLHWFNDDACTGVESADVTPINVTTKYFNQTHDITKTLAARFTARAQIFRQEIGNSTPAYHIPALNLSFCPKTL